MAVITLEQVTKVINRGKSNEIRPVTGVSITINPGEVVVLKGPSGSGKTSLLSLMGCMSRPSSGRIVVNGKDVAKLPERYLNRIRRNTFGFIFQQFNLIAGISVQENIMLPLVPTGIKMAEMQKRSWRIMEQLDLTRLKTYPVQRISGGEQQRVAIARALINDPGIILADEPTAHLDTKLSDEIAHIFRALKREGKTLIIATHDPLMHEREFVDRTVGLRDGRVTDIRTNQNGLR